MPPVTDIMSPTLNKHTAPIIHPNTNREVKISAKKGTMAVFRLLLTKIAEVFMTAIEIWILMHMQSRIRKYITASPHIT